LEVFLYQSTEQPPSEFRSSFIYLMNWLAWRDQRDWTAEKYRRFDRHERMPPDWKPPQRRASG